MALRDPLVQVLTDGLPDYTVVPNDLPDVVSRKSIAVYTRRLELLPQAPGAVYSLQHFVIVASPLEDFDKAEDERDAMLLDVLGVLWSDDPVCVIQNAEVASLGDKVIAWQIEVTRAVQKEN
jgi:hypothetical protein